MKIILNAVGTRRTGMAGISVFRFVKLKENYTFKTPRENKNKTNFAENLRL